MTPDELLIKNFKKEEIESIRTDNAYFCSLNSYLKNSDLVKRRELIETLKDEEKEEELIKKKKEQEKVFSRRSTINNFDSVNYKKEKEILLRDFDVKIIIFILYYFLI
jgi:hypothetical protein